MQIPLWPIPPPQHTGWSGFVQSVSSAQMIPHVQTMPAPGPPHAQAWPSGHAFGSFGFAVQSRPPAPVDVPVVPVVVPVDDELVIDEVVLLVDVPDDEEALVVAAVVVEPPEPPAPSASSPQPAANARRQTGTQTAS